MFSGIVLIFINNIQPVGITKVFIFPLIIDTHFIQRRIGIASYQFIIPVGRVLKYIIDTSRRRLLTFQISRIPAIGPLQTITNDTIFCLHRTLMHGETSVIIDFRLSGSSVLGSYQYHSESTTRTIDSSRRSVLQYRYTFHICGIHRVEIPLHPVYQHKGTTTRTNTSCSTKINGWRTRRFTVTECNVQPRYHTLQRTRNVTVAALCNLLAINLVHSTNQIYFLCRTVTYDHHFLQLLRIFLKYNLHLLVIFYQYLCF